MKREIKFRGKVKHHDPMTNPENGWVEGYYLQDLTQGEMRSYIFNCPYYWEVIPKTVGQFTGLLDKNGKEIYEGDIIRSFDSNHNEIVHYIEWDNSNARFVAVFKSNSELPMPMKNSISHEWMTDMQKEVIGNIYDNTELKK